MTSSSPQHAAAVPARTAACAKQADSSLLAPVVCTEEEAG